MPGLQQLLAVSQNRRQGAFLMTDFVSMLISYVAMFSCGLLLGWHTK
jgi:hypothetical protein